MKEIINTDVQLAKKKKKQNPPNKQKTEQNKTKHKVMKGRGVRVAEEGNFLLIKHFSKTNVYRHEVEALGLDQCYP